MIHARFLVAAAALLLLVMVVLPPIHQSPTYHDFADKRTLVAGIPNTLNVLSNALFIVAGVLAARAGRQLAAIAFALGTFATCAGSTYYHLAPGDGRLVYDRLGIVLCSAAIIALLIGRGLVAFLLLGIAGVAWWRLTGDLRPYGFVQFFPVLALIGKRDRILIGAAATYALAKVCEIFDHAIFDALHVVSGHTLKHLAAGAATILVAWWIYRSAALNTSTTRSNASLVSSPG